VPTDAGYVAVRRRRRAVVGARLVSRRTAGKRVQVSLRREGGRRSHMCTQQCFYPTCGREAPGGMWRPFLQDVSHVRDACLFVLCCVVCLCLFRVIELNVKCFLYLGFMKIVKYYYKRCSNFERGEGPQK